MHVRTNDLVIVKAGNEAGKTGKIIKILTDKKRVVIKGVNLVYKQVRKTRREAEYRRRPQYQLRMCCLSAKIRIVESMKVEYEYEKRCLKMVLRYVYVFIVVPK